ncbi:BAR-domain-containing protein [Marasmius fiardii PR-910]|nr:BAR-domain-containing protein [Marasmius fiardii PR-910]
MASKQLGKLRQWAGEVISSREKTTLSEEFQELEKDIELRRSGNERLFFACETYHHILKKKKDCLALDDPEKLLPIDILGIIMITHGEEFGEDSVFGSSLVKLGRAHCRVAALQEGYALTFRDTYMTSVEKFGDEIKEYDHLRKKLDSRRLSYDAALSKLEKVKHHKKEKERRDAEEELDKAQARYEETTEDVRAQMHQIQEYEIDQMRELTALLDIELNFVEKYAEVLREVKSEWPSISSVRPATRVNGITRTTSKQKEKSTKSGVGRSASTRSTGHSTAIESSEEGEDETRSAISRSRTPSRRSSMVHHRSDSAASKPRSRPSSRASRKRADSYADEEKVDKAASKLSVAGLMGSLSGRVKKKEREKFANLDDEVDMRANDDRTETEDHDPSSSPVQSHKSFSGRPSSTKRRARTHSKSKSEQISLSGSSPSPTILSRMQGQLQREPDKDRKIVRALHDFSGSSDELSFKTGDEIVVLNETLEGWWMGEVKGRKGLFPVPYTEPVPAKPPLPVRPDLAGKGGGTSATSLSNSINSFSDSDGYRSSDIEDNEVYGTRPLALHDSPFIGVGGGLPDSASFTDSLLDDNHDRDSQLLKPSLSHVSRTGSGTFSTSSTSSSALPYRQDSGATPKKAPPPPPPRRSTGNLLPSATPPIPPRRPSAPRSQSSSGSLPQFIPNSSPSVSSQDGQYDRYDRSPFDSVTELSQSGNDGKSNPF